MLLNFFKKKEAEMGTTINDIERINKLLSNGASLNKLDKTGELGCSRRAYCNRLKSMGYILDKDTNTFIRKDLTDRSSKALLLKDSPKTTPELFQEKNEEIIQPKKNSPKVTINELLERIIILESKVLLGDTKVTQECFILDTRVTQDTEVTSRGMKVNKNALDEFDNLCKELKQYSKQDLLSQALFEFVDKYKNK